jgi:hypothetical protein
MLRSSAHGTSAALIRHQLLTSTGSLLLTYGTPVAHRWTYGVRITDPAGS